MLGVIFPIVSLAVVLLFSGVLLANRNTQDVLFRALGNLVEDGAPDRVDAVVRK